MLNNTKKTIYRQRIGLSILFACVGASQVQAASPQKSIKEGNIFYEQGDYVASEGKYKEALAKDPESDIVNFNLGAALYKKEQYEEAIDHFQKVFLSDDERLKLKAYYNSGNALYKVGMSEEQKGSAALAIPPVENSLKQYERALEINENDEDTKHNYGFVQAELKRLQEKKQQEQQQGQGKESQQSEDQEQQQQQDQQSQNDQNQQGREDQQQQHDGREQQQDQGNEQDGQQKDQQQGTDQERGQEGSMEDNNEQKTGAQPQSASELTPQEALMLLEGYQQAEEPQQPLNMQPKNKNTGPVFNDW
jgi:tetratricopeptide (TPR) repeat protein